MKVLEIDVNCKKSSTGKIVYDLFLGGKKVETNMSVCYGRGEAIDEDGIYKFGYDWETRLHALLARITGYNACFSFFSTKRLLKFIEKFNPDVIHLHELHAYFVNIRMLIKYIKKKQIPVVWTFHCEYMYTGKCGHAYDCMKFQDSCGKCPAVHEYPKSIFFDKTKQMLEMKRRIWSDLDATIVTPSPWLENRVRQSFLKDKQVRVIFNGVDTSIFHPTEARDLKLKLDIKNGCKVVLFVAPDVSDKKKGGHWIHLIANQFSTEKIIFLMVGGGKIPELIPSNVKYVGPVYCQEELAQYYSISSAFILCSERETFSMTCAEALCCGTPVVGFMSGAPESVFQKPYAIFVKPRSLYDLVKELRKVIAWNDMYRDNISSMACATYGTNVMVKKYIDLYKEVAKRNS